MAVVFDHATFFYPGREENAALDGLSLQIKGGEFVAVAGPNGSGKSTLCKLINGLILPARGEVFTCELNTSVKENLDEIRRSVGLIMQNPDNQIIGPTVEDDVAFGLENLALPRPEMEARVEEILETMDLVELRRREPNLLSEGEKRRLIVAGALAMQPKILVSDESTSMLDPPTRADIIELYSRLCKENGITIVHATHRSEEIMAADRVALLAEGSLIYDGRPEELFTDGEFAAEHYLQAPVLFLLARELEARGFSMPRKPVAIGEVLQQLWA